MTDPMTDRELAGCALSEVLALLEKATPGEWSHAAEYGWNIATDNYDPMSRVGASVGMALWPKDAYAICAAVNFLRQHGPALLAALSNPSSEGDAVEQLTESEKEVALGQAVEFAEYVERQAKGAMRDAAKRFLSLPYALEIAARLDAAHLANPCAAIAAAERGGAPDLP